VSDTVLCFCVLDFYTDSFCLHLVCMVCAILGLVCASFC